MLFRERFFESRVGTNKYMSKVCFKKPFKKFCMLFCERFFESYGTIGRQALCLLGISLLSKSLSKTHKKYASIGDSKL